MRLTKKPAWTTNDELRSIAKVPRSKLTAYLAVIKKRKDWGEIDALVVIGYAERLISDDKEELPRVRIMNSTRFKTKSELKYIDNLTYKDLISYIADANYRDFHPKIDKETCINHAKKLARKSI